MLPARAALRRAIARAVMGAFQRRGYDPVVPPAFEREDVLVRGLGPGAAESLLRLVDPDSGEVLALRPDMTPQIARIVATRYRDAPMPVRLAYEGTVLRRPRGRSRRHRQVAQAGVECVGVASVDADAEVIAAACEALAAAGVPDGRVTVAHAGVHRALLARVAGEGARRPWPRPSRRATGRRGSGSSGETRRAPWRARRARRARGGRRACCGRRRRRSGGGAGGGVRGARRAASRRSRRRGSGGRRSTSRRRGATGTTRGRRLRWCARGRGGGGVGGCYDELLGRYGAAAPATGCAVALEVLEELVARRAAAAGGGRARRGGGERPGGAAAARWPRRCGRRAGGWRRSTRATGRRPCGGRRRTATRGS